MLKSLFFFLPILFLVGCARIVTVAEALQQPMDSKIYLKCNLFYQNPNAISSVNYQGGGKFIPLGTEVNITLANERRIEFNIGGKEQYTVVFDKGMMMIPMQEYMRRIFTIEPKEDRIKEIEPEILSAIEKGTIVKGMTRNEVKMACGEPIVARTPDQNNATWVYFIEQNKTYRVFFNGKKVGMLLNVNKPIGGQGL